MNFDFRLRDPVDDNNSEKINLPQMQESRYRETPKDSCCVGIDSLAERDVLLVFEKNASGAAA
jgi:hypothetical protein